MNRTAARQHAAMMTRRAKKAVQTRRRRAVFKRSFGGPKLTEKEFTALPKATQRMLLAFDVLEWIRLKKVTISTGSYVCYGDSGMDGIDGIDGDQQANKGKAKQCLLNSECHVCAKGCMFMAHVMRANEATVRDIVEVGHTDIQARLTEQFKLFTKEQFHLLEACFEKDKHLNSGDLNVSNYDSKYEGDALTKRFDLAEQFGFEFSEEDERMAAMMVNMIKHGGTFVPSDIPKADEVKAAMTKKSWGRELTKV